MMWQNFCLVFILDGEAWVSQQRYHIHVCLVKNEQPDLENALQIATADDYFLTWDLNGSPSNFMDYTRHQIDRCDYVLLVLGDSYGNLSPSGVSYLHLSYVYATTKRKALFTLIKQADAVIAQNETATRQRTDFAGMIEKDQAEYTTLYHHNAKTAIIECLDNLRHLIEAVPKSGWIKSTKLPTQHHEQLFTPSKSLAKTKSATPASVDRFSTEALLSESRGKKSITTQRLVTDSPVYDGLSPDRPIDRLVTNTLSKNTQKTPNMAISPAGIAERPLIASPMAEDGLSLEDSLTVGYTAHAYKDGNLSELNLRQELMWLDIVASLRKLKEPFNSDMIQRNLNHLLNGFALTAAKKIQPNTHAVARTQINSTDFDWLKQQLIAQHWLTPATSNAGAQRDWWQLSDELK